MNYSLLPNCEGGFISNVREKSAQFQLVLTLPINSFFFKSPRPLTIQAPPNL